MEQKKKNNPADYNLKKVELIADELGEDWKNRVLEKFNYTDPSLWLDTLSYMVCKEIQLSSDNPKSVRVYAILTEETEEDMYKYLEYYGQ